MRTFRFVARTPIAAPARELHAWHLRPGALERLTPPWERVEVVLVPRVAESVEEAQQLLFGVVAGRYLR